MAKSKLTEELLDQLLSEPRIEGFLQKEEFTHITLPALLDKLMTKYHKSKAEIIHTTTINDTHAYQIFSGDRRASRGKIIQMSLALGCNIKDANHLLNAAGVSEFYCKNRRDAIIIFCLKEGYSVNETNDTLYKFGEDTLD